MSTYRIAEVADRSGFTPATLRYYEDIGLVRPASRTDAGYRLYDDDSLTRLRFIARAKQLGCTLDEIAELSQVWDGGRCAPLQERLRATVAAKVVESRRQIAELTVLTADLQRAAAGLAVSPTGACDDTCGCLTDGPSGGAGDGPSDERAVARAVPLLDLAGADAVAGTGAGGCGDDACGCDGNAPTGDDPPVACTLDPRQMGARLDEWTALLDAGDGGLSGVVARTALDDGVRLELGPATDVAELVRLAAAEQDCCRFLRFSVSIDTRGVALEVRAPLDAVDVVAALFGVGT